MKKKEFVQKLVEAVVPELTLGGSYGLSYDLFYKGEMELKESYRHHPATLWIDHLKGGRVSIKLKPHTFWTDRACLECVDNLKRFASEMGLKNVTVKPYYTATYNKRWAVKLICDKPWGETIQFIDNPKVWDENTERAKLTVVNDAPAGRIEEKKETKVVDNTTKEKKNYPIWVMGVCVGFFEI